MAIARRALEPDPPEPAPELEPPAEPNEALAWVRMHLAWERRLAELHPESDAH